MMICLKFVSWFSGLGKSSAFESPLTSFRPPGIFQSQQCANERTYARTPSARRSACSSAWCVSVRIRVILIVPSVPGCTAQAAVTKLRGPSAGNAAGTTMATLAATTIAAPTSSNGRRLFQIRGRLDPLASTAWNRARACSRNSAAFSGSAGRNSRNSLISSIAGCLLDTRGIRAPKRLPDPHPDSIQPTADGAHRNAEGFGRFGVGQVGPGDKQQQVDIALWQLGQHLDQLGSQLLGCHPFSRAITEVVNERLRRNGLKHSPPHRLGPPVLADLAYRDAVKPGPSVQARRVVVGAPVKCREEGLGGHILSVLRTKPSARV